MLVDGVDAPVPYQPSVVEGEGGSKRSSDPNTEADAGASPVLIVSLGEGGMTRDEVLRDGSTTDEAALVVKGANVGLGVSGACVPVTVVDEAVEEPSSVKYDGDPPRVASNVISVVTTAGSISISSDAWHIDQSTKPALSAGSSSSLSKATLGEGTLLSET